eukprot:s733_g10.t3
MEHDNLALNVEVGLVSGRTTTVQAALDETVGTLKRRAQIALGIGMGSLLDSFGCFVDGCTPVKKARMRNGDRLTLLHTSRVQVQASAGAFAAILSDGSVVTWGDANAGADSSRVQNRLKNVQQVQASDCAFAAILDDGSVVTWGDAVYGGSSSVVQDQLKHVQQIQASSNAFAAILSDGSVASRSAFAAILDDGSVVTWGDAAWGGDSSSVQGHLKTVQQIQATHCAFAAILDDGSVVTWGDANAGGDSSAVQDQLKNLRQIQSSCGAFAAILSDGSVVTWGDANAGAASSRVQNRLKNVQQVQASDCAFAAMLDDGSVVTWGDAFYGGNSSFVQDQLKTVRQVQCTATAFAAILDDGSVVTWGDAIAGGDSRAVQDQLRDVRQIQSACLTFAAIRSDGSIVTWGVPQQSAGRQYVRILKCNGGGPRMSRVGVLVQYHAEGSSSYIAGDCLVRGLLRCYSTWHKQMHLRGEFNDWGQDSDLDMVPVDHFTWAANLTVDRFLRAKFAPGRGWEKSYGIHPTRKLLYGLPLFDPRSKDFEVEPYMSGAAASRRWMVERGRWSAHESITTSADFAADIWISHRCTPEPPPCEPPEASEVGWKCHSYRSGEDFAWCASAGTQGCVMFAPRNASEDMASCGTCDCCRKQVAVLPKGDRRQCCILFNDLLLNYTITDDLSRCVARGASPAPSWTLSSETSFQDARGSRCTDAGGSREVDKAASQTIMPPEASERGDELLAAWVPSQWKTALGLSVFILMLIGLPFCHAPARLYLSIVRQSQAPLESPRPPVADKATEGSKRSKRHVVFASLEHNVPELNIRGFTGDAGIFLEDLAKEHPRGTISFIHPMLGGCDYGELAWFTDLSMLVDGKSYVAKVLRWESPKKEKGVKKVWYFVQHELFLERMQESIYPGPMSKLRVLRFFSLWNQAVALLLDALRPDVFNCLDCHQAMAPLYLSELHIPMVLMLRKPLEMGSVDSELICDRCWKTTIALRRLSVVFNLKLPTLRNFCTFEGRFNMMWAAVQRIKDCQSGRGLCVLSAATAASLRREHSLFQALQRKPRALGHPSRLVSLDVDSSVEDLKKQRASAKAALQRRAHLKEDPKARILLFAGPWAQHTGAAQVAEVLPLILVRHSSVQVALFGTCSDLHGVLAQDGLAQVVSSFPGRVAVLDRLDFRRGVDFLLAPFNAEPVGQQDVELGLVGVPTCGCAVGALGRIPGVYFRPQNSASTLSLASALFCALEYCLTMEEEEYWQLAKAATRTAQEGFGESFHHNLTEVYREVETAFQKPPKNWGGAGALLWETDASQEELHRAVRARRSTPLRRVSATADMANEMEVIDIFDDREFLTQPVSETKAHDIMKAVAEEVLVSSAPTESAVALQRDISQARQLREERDVVERCLMKPCAWNLCLRIHLVMALCYTTTACGELLLQSLEVEGVAGRLVPSAQLWSAYHAGEALGAVLWLTLSYGLPPNLLMATSQALGMASFLLLPLLPEHLLEAKWSILSFAAVSGVQGSSRLLFLIWNFSEELQHGFQVAIWRLGLLEGLRRSVAWLALMTSYAESLWIYKQVPSFRYGFGGDGFMKLCQLCFGFHCGERSRLLLNVAPPPLPPRPPEVIPNIPGDSGPPLLRPALSSESLGSSSKPGYLERRKIAMIQAYKDHFLEQVKAKRQKSVSTAAATGILREVPFFQEFDDVLPGTIYRLARLAVMQDGAEGEVLFRQGDEPVDCYVVLRGKVGVYISSTPQESPRDFTLDYVRVVEDETKKSRVSRFCRCCRFRRERLCTFVVGSTQELDDSYRRYVSEGFNTYTPDSNLGTKVADLGRGAAFGELGLMERKPLLGRCESKCTFVVIRRSAFQKWFSESISADAYRTRLYFISRIAGFQMETLRNPIKKPERTLGGKSRTEGHGQANVKQTVHPVDRFREEDYKPGHVLLQEGQQHESRLGTDHHPGSNCCVSIPEPIIFIVRSGHISVSRKSRRRLSTMVSVRVGGAGFNFSHLDVADLPPASTVFRCTVSATDPEDRPEVARSYQDREPGLNDKPNVCNGPLLCDVACCSQLIENWSECLNRCEAQRSKLIHAHALTRYWRACICISSLEETVTIGLLQHHRRSGSDE